MAVKTLNIGSKKRGYWVALGFGKSESGGGKLVLPDHVGLAVGSGAARPFDVSLIDFSNITTVGGSAVLFAGDGLYDMGGEIDASKFKSAALFGTVYNLTIVPVFRDLGESFTYASTMDLSSSYDFGSTAASKASFVAMLSGLYDISDKGFTCTIKTRIAYTAEMQAIAAAKGWTLSN